jgi:hypothetical protein
MRSWGANEEMKMSEQHRENLMKLCVGTMNYTGFEFDMNDYRTDGDEPADLNDENPACGTVACFAGHGPVIEGLEIKENQLSPCFGMTVLYWPKYIQDYFGCGSKDNSRLADWLFGFEWAKKDNTKVGAVARALYYLENGLPADFITAREKYVQDYQPYIAKAEALRV